MRRVALTLVLLAGVATLLVAGSRAGGGESYEVRAIFENGGFLVPGEEVRVAGARVGKISEVDVTDAQEAAHANGSPEPGSAVVVMAIETPGFQDFRTDASCVIRPQSLLGERFVECEPTQPRAAGSEAPPALATLGEGEPGEGQRLLPIEQNRKAVDLDLVNNIMDEPYPDRFRLLLNEFGAGLATRGDELEEIIDRANPALQETNEVLAILADQERALESLAQDGDQVLGPLARDRERIGSFVRNATVTAEATAERRADLEAGLQKLPGFLREIRLTMPELQAFADQATPTVSALGAAAPELTRATLALEPFADAATISFESLGDALEESTPNLLGSDPILVKLRDLAKRTRPGALNLNKLLRSTRERNGFDYLTRLIYNLAGATNGFDSFGHFLRGVLPTNNCVDYEVIAELGCEGDFTDDPAAQLSAQNAFLAGADNLIARMQEREGTDSPRDKSEGAEALLKYLTSDGGGKP